MPNPFFRSSRLRANAPEDACNIPHSAFRIPQFSCKVFFASLTLALVTFASVAQIISPASLPLFFEGNSDQTQFLSSGSGYQFAISASGVQMALQESRGHPATAQMRFVGGNPAAQIHGGGEMPGKINYFIGNDPSKWQTGLPTFANVQVTELYPGINMVFHGNQRQLEYDFTIAPGADPNDIKMRFDGVDRISISPQGDLILTIGSHELRQPLPGIFQSIGGARNVIAGGYKIVDSRTVAFGVGKYDHSLPLIIDPALGFSTYFGGTASDAAWAIAVDTNGFLYIAGQTLSKGFATFGAFQTNYAGGTAVGDAFVAKFGSPATNLVYLTYLGGTANDAAYSLAVDGYGQAFIAGATESTNFPSTNAIPGHAQISGGEGPTGQFSADAFVAEFNAGGSNLIYSTYLGGNGADAAYGIALDSSDDAYVTGFSYSTNFPVTANALQPTLRTTNVTTVLNANAFVTEITNGGGALVYSTYLGGTNYDVGRAITLDTSNDVYVAGSTASFNFPTWNTNTPANLPYGRYLNGVTNQTGGLHSDAFVTKFPPLSGTIPPSAQTNFYSTFLGGTNSDGAYGIAADSAGNAYVTGFTASTNFPVISPPGNMLPSFLTTNGNNGSVATNVFLAKLGPFGSLSNSVVFGGNLVDIGYGVTVDPEGDAFVVGTETSYTNFPTRNTFPAGFLLATNSTGIGESDAFVTGISADWTNVFYSVCIGGNRTTVGSGIALDSSTNVYITGLTRATNYPTLNTGRFWFSGTNFIGTNFVSGTNFINGTNYINGMNFSGSTDAFFSEIVFAPPVPSNFAVVPTDQTNGLGATVTFALTFTGATNSDIFFQWQTNGHNLVNGGRISGANSATLTITNAQPSDSRTNYGVIVSYPGGTFAQSNLVSLVLSGPYIVVGPADQVIIPGSNVTFSVIASGAQPLTYAWAYSNSVFINYITDYTNYITNSDHYIGVTNATLTISNVQPGDAGAYIVVVNPFTDNPVNAGALLVQPFSIISAPTNEIVSPGSTINFTVVANGFPLSYQWSNSVTGTFLTNGTETTIGTATNGIEISSALNTSNILIVTNTLTIANVQTNDAGTYTVFINNGQTYTDLSGTTNLSATLSILSDPTFTRFAPTAGGIGNGTVLSGAGGKTNGMYYVLTSSNLLVPAAQWTPMTTNQFDSQGKFIFTNPVSTNGSQFFMLKQP